MIPADWKSLERHPLSADYEDISGIGWENFLADLAEFGILARSICLHDGKVLDGWQLQRGCVELDIEPFYTELPADVTAEDFVRVKNNNRRHEGAEIVERRHRVHEARRRGESLRTIAETENISVITVRRDLESSGVPGGGTPEPIGGTVVGKDNKVYQAKSTVSEMSDSVPPDKTGEIDDSPTPETPKNVEKLKCARCQRNLRVGLEVPKNCEMCRELNPTKPRATPAPKEMQDAFGNQVPGPRQAAYGDPWIQHAIDFLGVTEAKFRELRLADGMVKRASHYPFFNSKDFVDGLGFTMNYLDQILTHLKDFRPAGVCPACSGAGCADCKLSGMVPRTLYAELKEVAL